MRGRCNRRRYLAWLAATGTVAIAGCEDAEGGGNDDRAADDGDGDTGGQPDESSSSDSPESSRYEGDETGEGDETEETDDSETTDGDEPSPNSWPTFGSDPGNSGYNDGVSGSIDDLSRSWEADRVIEFSEPERFGIAVGEGLVFGFTEGDERGADFRWYAIFAVDADTGEVRWKRELTELEGAGYGYRAAATPTVSGGTLYVTLNPTSGGDPGVVVALSAADGEQRWATDVSSRTGGSPVVLEDTVYVAGEEIVGLDAETGDRRSSVGVGRYDYSLATDGSTAVVVPDHTMVGVDLETGDVSWETPLVEVVNDRESPALAGGLVFHSHEHTGYAVDVETGEIRWQTDEGVVDGPKPAATDDVAVFVHNESGNTLGEQDECSVVAFEADSGAERWRRRFSTQIHAPPTVAGGRVFVCGMDETLYVLDLETGDTVTEAWGGGLSAYEPVVTDAGVFVAHERGITGLAAEAADDLADVGRWPSAGYDARNTRSNPDATPPRKGIDVAWTSDVRIERAPVVADGVVLAGGRGELVAFEGTSGRVRWRETDVPDRAVVSSRPVVTDGVAAFGSQGGGVIAVDVRSGERAWRFDGAGEVIAPTTAMDGVAYAVDAGGTLHGLDLETGERVAEGAISQNTSVAPAAADGRVFVASGGLFAFDADGESLWYDAASVFPASSPTAVDDLVVASVNDGSIRAYDASDGTESWSYTLDVVDGGLTMQPTAYHDGVVYATGWADSSQERAQLIAVDAETGGLRWRHGLDDWATAPTVADGVVYVGTRTGRIVGVDPGSGDAILEGALPDGQPARFELAAADDRLYVTADETLFALEEP